MPKRILSFCLAFLLTITAFPLSVFGATVQKGTCGDHLTWKFSSTGVLTISGTGDMYDYNNEEHGAAPWEFLKINTRLI